MFRSLLLAVAIGMFAVALLLLLVWWGQERVVFQPPTAGWGGTPPERRVELRAEDGTPLFAYLVGDSRGGPQRHAGGTGVLALAAARRRAPGSRDALTARCMRVRDARRYAPPPPGEPDPHGVRTSRA